MERSLRSALMIDQVLRIELIKERCMAKHDNHGSMDRSEDDFNLQLPLLKSLYQSLHSPKQTKWKQL